MERARSIGRSEALQREREADRKAREDAEVALRVEMEQKLAQVGGVEPIPILSSKISSLPAY